MGKGIRVAPRDSLLMLSEPKTNLGKAVGFRKALDNLGALVGPLLLAFLLTYILTPDTESTYRLIFFLSLIPAFLSVCTLIPLKEFPAKPQSARSILNSIGHNPALKSFIFAMFIFALGNFSISFFLLKTGSYISLALVPLAYFMFNLTSTLFSVPAGAAAGKMGGRFTIFLAQLVFLICLAGFAAFPGAYSVFLLMALLGIFMALYETAPRIFIANNVEKNKYASSLGLYKGLIGFAALPANLIAGFIWNEQLYGLPLPFLFSICTTLLSLVLFVFLFQEVRTQMRGLLRI